MHDAGVREDALDALTREAQSQRTGLLHYASRTLHPALDIGLIGGEFIGSCATHSAATTLLTSAAGATVAAPR